MNNEYPRLPGYETETYLERINLDKERRNDIDTGNGFIVKRPKGIKKDVKAADSVFSTRFGQTLGDLNPFMDRYRCKCGHLMHRSNNNIICPCCGEPVRYVDDNFQYFGWLVLKDPYYIIHPNIYRALSFLIGSTKLDNMINIVDEKDIDGHHVELKDRPKDEPFYGIGMMQFKERFEEIMEYYNTPKKREYYEDIMRDKDKIFIQSIPVYTTLLRPFDINTDFFHYEDNNGRYYMMAKLAGAINNDRLKIYRKSKIKESYLYDLQQKYNELYREIIKILEKKKGIIRTCFGGRYSFSSRDVIVQDTSLAIDEISLPYKALVELCQQTIINTLQKLYNINYSDAYNIWYAATIKIDQRVWDILDALIKNNKRGLPVMINRNPTIAYGGILQMFVVKMNVSYTMGVPLRILPLIAGDFDGDVLNLFYIINQDFFNAAYLTFNPRNAFAISRDDGKFNNDVNHQKDTLINANSLIGISRKYYNNEQIEKIRQIKEKQRQMFGMIE